MSERRRAGIKTKKTTTITITTKKEKNSQSVIGF